MKRVVVLGSTGSIGVQALEVIQAAGEELQLVGISAQTSWEDAIAQADKHRVDRIAIADAGAAETCAAERSGILGGAEGVRELVATSEADLVLNAITGSAGLGPTIVALSEGIDLALANKESLVVGGELITALAEATQAAIIPVDSEHSALFQLINSEQAPGTVEKLVLTASGGPFRERDDLSAVTIDEALAHPTWEMGGRITIDSATLFNKGLELIEAHHLFDVAYSSMDVVVHPQSIIHSLIHLNDGASLAHMGYPDMRVPISYALHFPDRADVPLPSLDLAQLGSLTFEEPDLDRFPCLRLAREAGEAGGTAPCVLNAADEVAVSAFLGGEIPFTAIPRIVARTLEEMPAAPPTHFDDLIATDSEARRRAAETVQALG
jgi:1-deoxy-D-xylulose-5-phosphate reductoisomerase